ncbi:hypothetical protein PybrP1_010114 [[Pythium] brassicae (nom. inval.)]|nr:hypothetical protein PybrP1_010114 [[Pythium] brassicae (nom. inval.)]
MAPTTATTATASSSSSSDAENIAAVLEKTTSDPRFTRGLTLLKEKRLEEAVVVYEDLLRTMIETENQSDSLAVAPVYYQYGHSMLLLAEATASVFGGSVAPPEAGSDADADAEQDAKNTADDLEVAWEMLEVARVIYSRFPNELAVEKELARVYMRLGDLGMESDVFEQAKSDYEKSLQLRQKIIAQTQDPDTTLLADLYCCLAISCIYQESKLQADDGDDADGDGDSADPSARQDEIRRRESEGLAYYVLAGRVMADNIHRVAGACAQVFQDFAAARIPRYSAADGADTARGAVKAKGKGKSKLQPQKPELRFLMPDGMDAVRDAFLACAQVLKGPAASGDAAESLSPDEAQLLEYMEIYVELKEKVDGILESASAEAVAPASSSGKRNADALADDAHEAAITTIGFGATATATEAAEAAPVNVISVKKRKRAAFFRCGDT